MSRVAMMERVSESAEQLPLDPPSRGQGRGGSSLKTMALLPPASAGHSLRPALAILVALLLAACSQAATSAAPVATNQVDLPTSYRFAPADITITAGSEVTWTNHDNFTHSVRLLDSGEVELMKPGESVSHTFTIPGLFRYDCSLHPNDMKGSVLVEGGAR